jgi:excinuclease ABC subunit C
MDKNLKKQADLLPTSPGVYLMKGRGGEILYIGKASSLRSRVASYFEGPLERRFLKMLEETKKIDYIKTDSGLEALLKEAELVKTYQPKYNIRLKDDKSFVEIAISQEEYPRVWLIRARERKKISLKFKALFGPFTQTKQVKAALEILRKIFPYRSCKKFPKKPCFYYQIKQCLGPCVGKISSKDYLRIIQNFILFLKGEKKRLIKVLEKEMTKYAKELNFEKAKEIREKIFALRHIQDIALVKREERLPFYRIEAYDISNIKGAWAAGAMTVFEEGQILKDEYRRFKIKNVRGINDTAMLKEIFQRRFSHKEWPLPHLIVIDGGRAQLNAVKEVMKKYRLKIPLIALAKGAKRRKEKVLSYGKIPSFSLRAIKELRDEAHRFSLQYHKFLRKKIR